MINVSKLIMSWREFVPNFGRGIFYILLSVGHYSNACLAPNGTISGMVGERLDILCPLHFPNIAEQQIILYINSQPMIIMEFKKTKTPAIDRLHDFSFGPLGYTTNTATMPLPFDPRGNGYCIVIHVHCTSDHPYKKMCQTQMNLYADKKNVHFVIDKVPETLNGSTSQCGTDFKKKTRRDPPRTVILRERIKGYVNGTIIIPCPIPNGHREWFVGLKINMTNRAQVWNQSTDDFHCVTGSHYFDMCRNHMNGSSYVNGSSVFFVIESTPAFLNNSELHCFAVNFLILKENDHDSLEKILTLYKVLTDTTTKYTVSTPTLNATVPNATDYSSPGPETNGLSTGAIIGIVIAILVLFIVTGVIFYKLVANAVANAQAEEMQPMGEGIRHD